MDTYGTAVESFKAQDYTGKKSRLISLLEAFQEQSPSIKELLSFAQNDKIQETDMLDIYTSLVSSIQSVQGEKMEASLNKIDQLHQKLLQLQEKERLEKAQENPDELLTHI